MKSKNTLNRQSRCLGISPSSRWALSAGLVALALPLFVGTAHAASVTWASSTTGGNWSTQSGWTTGAGTSGPITGDTATLDDATANRTVIYDAGATGALGTLNLTETSAFNNTLQLARSLNVTNAITLGGTNGAVILDLQAQTLTAPTVTVNTGAQLLIGNNTTWSGASNAVSGSLALNGGLVSVATGTGNATIAYISNGMTINSGTLALSQVTGTGVRFTVGSQTTGAGNFTFNAGTISISGYSTGGNSSVIYLYGATNTIGSSAVLSDINGATVFGFTLNAYVNQSLTYATSSLFDFHARAVAGATGSIVKTLTYNGAGTGQIGAIGLENDNVSGTTTVKMGSNLTVASGRSLVYGDAAGAAAGKGNLVFDLNGFTYDGTEAIAGWKPVSVGGTDTWTVASSAAGGVFKTAAFDFSSSNLRINIGANATLWATGAIGNNFAVGSGTASVTFDPTSTFLYTGASSTVTTGTTVLGNVTVGDGSAASAVTVGSGTLSLAGKLTIRNNATLLLAANTLAASGSSVLINSGGNLNTNNLTQTLIGQISGSSGASSALAYLNLTANNTLAAGSTLDLSSLPNVSIGASGVMNLFVTAGGNNATITPGNSTYQLGSPTGTLTIAATLLKGASNGVTINGNVNLVGGGDTTGVNATFGGPLIIKSGTLSESTNSRLPSGVALTVYAGAVFNPNGSDALTPINLGSLSGAGTVLVSGSSKTLWVTGTTNTTFSGNVTESGVTGAFTKAGASTLILSGTNTYSGLTAVNAGTLQIGDGTTGSIASGSATVVSGAVLAFNQANGASYAGNISNNGTVFAFASGTNTLSGKITGAGAFVQNGSGRTILSGSNSYSGATTVSAGWLDITGTSSGSAFSVSSGATLGGTGIIGGAVTTNGTIAGGLTFNNDVTINHGATASASAFKGNIVNNGTITSAVNVQTGKILSGTGSVTNSVTVLSGAKTSAGNGNNTGVLTLDLTYNSGATANFNVSGSSGATSPTALKSGLAYSQVAVSGSAGAVNLQIGTGTALSQIQADGSSNSGVALELTLSVEDFAKLTSNATNNYQAGQANTSVDNFFVFTLGSGLVEGRFQTLELTVGGIEYIGTIYYSGTNDRYNGVSNLGDVIVNGQEFALSYTGDASLNSVTGGNDLVLTAIPEPGTWAMLVGGIGLLAFGQRMRRRASN